MIWIILYFMVGLICAIFNYGIILAYFQRKYPFRAAEEYSVDKRTALFTAFVTLLFFPVAILVYFDLSSRAKYGLMFKRDKT